MNDRRALSDRLTQMMSDTAAAAGLSDLDAIEERESTPCTTEPSKDADSWVIHYPQVEEAEARRLLREIYSYWESNADGWAQDGFDVIDDGIDTKSTPAVNLNIDGFSLGASYFPAAEVAAFQFAGTAPCVERSET